jgi:hypothetical protein
MAAMATEPTFTTPMTYTWTKVSSDHALPALRGLVTPERTPNKSAIRAFERNWCVLLDVNVDYSRSSLSPTMEGTPYFPHINLDK